MTIKLTFPNGEHEPVMLGEGVTAIGTDSSCQVVLAAPGIALRHCEIIVRSTGATLRVPDPRNVVVLNGRQISQEMPVKIGDLLLFAKIGCQVTALAPATKPPIPRPAPVAAGDYDGRTRVRQALPRYILRGVSGSTFGKVYAVAGTMVIGRQADCDIAIPAEEISRQHARLQASADGVIVEDLGSANGTFINDKRVQTGVLKPGEELRLDTVRFLLIMPGAETGKAAVSPSTPAVIEPESKSKTGAIVVSVVVLAIAAMAAAKYFHLF